MKSIPTYDQWITLSSSYNYFVKARGKGRPLICLHGFAEDHSTWDSIAIAGYQLYSIDLLGHGKSSRPTEKQAYVFSRILEELHELIQQLVGEERYSLLGYSQGGRLALAYGIRYAQEIDSLILESAGLGIKDRKEKENRKINDHQLAADLLKNGMNWFENYWSALPIFSSQQDLPKKIKQEIKERRLANSPQALAHILTEWGQGNQPYHGEEIERLTLPVLYLAGAKDHKYRKIAQILKDRKPEWQVFTIEEAGHNCHLEQPKIVEAVMTSFLNEQDTDDKNQTEEWQNE